MYEKKINYCWFGGAKKPEIVLRCIESWRKFMPDWEIKEWNEDNYHTNSSYFEKALKKKKYAFASDYARFDILNRFGGIYLDTDMELIKNLQPLVEKGEFIGRESRKFINAGIIFFYSKNKLADQVLIFLNKQKNPGVQAIPETITKIIDESDLNFNLKIYPPNYFYPYNPFDVDRNAVKQLMYSDITGDTYAIHHWGQSWSYSFYERIYRRLRKLCITRFQA